MTGKELRERRADLERQIKGRRCQVCNGIPQVAYVNQEFIIRCPCYPSPPAIYKPETGTELYERTGTGDTISIMQVERWRAKRIKRARERMADMNNSEMALFKTPDGQDVGLDVQTVKDIFCKNATDVEALLFLRVCQFQGMNPFLRDAYLIKYDDRKPASIVVGKGFYEQRAAEDPQYAGMRAGIVVERMGEQVELEGMLTRKTDILVGGWAEVHRLDRKFPTKITVSLAEYSKSQATWNQIPATMIRKVALVQALREAFPNRFHPVPGMESGQVIDEEELPYIEGQAHLIEEPEEETAEPIAPDVDEDGVIQDAPTFRDKGEVHSWFREQHDLSSIDIRRYYPKGKMLPDLSIEELVDAGWQAVAARALASEGRG